MAIGTTAALIGSAVISAGAGVMSASSNSKAINKSLAAEQQMNAESIALQRDIYQKNNALLDPYNQRGNAAGDAINALLGLPTAGQLPSSTAADPNYAAYVQSYPDLLREYQRDPIRWGSLDNYGQFHYQTYGQGEGRALPTAQSLRPQTSSPANADNAFQNYLNSSGYQFRFNQGNNALANSFGGRLADSGAAVKAALRYGQDYGSNEFGKYLGYLGNQQGVGLAGASAVAGVGQNYANNVSNLNSQNANSISQAAIAKANNTNSLLSGLSSSFGTALGGMSGFGGVGNYPYGGTLGAIY